MVSRSKENNFIKLITIFFIALLILLFLSWMYVFNIYEVRINLLSTEDSPYYRIEIVPVNSFGYKTPLRKVDYTFEIVEGENDVDVITEKENEIFVAASGKHGLIKLKIETDKTQNQTLIEIPTNR